MAAKKKVARKSLTASAFTNIKVLLHVKDNGKPKYTHQEISDMTGFSLTTIQNVKKADTLDAHRAARRKLVSAETPTVAENKVVTLTIELPATTYGELSVLAEERFDDVNGIVELAINEYLAGTNLNLRGRFDRLKRAIGELFESEV